MINICILDSETFGSDVSLSMFDKLGKLTVYDKTRPEEVAERIKDQDIVVSNKVVLNGDNLPHAQKLKLICISATGVNNVDLHYAREKGIAVTNVSGYSTGSVVQHTFALYFFLEEKLRFHDNYVRSGDYTRSGMFTYLGQPFGELAGKTWGIIGLGEIGKGVAKIAGSFGCRVIYYSTSGKNSSGGYERLELDELLKQADVVSIHSPLNKETQNLITAEELALMKKNAILINVGRGGIVNEKHLAEALDKGLLAGAALDVLEKEPIAEDNPLMHIKEPNKLVITPHIAWASREARTRLLDGVAANIEAFLRGESRNRV